MRIVFYDDSPVFGGHEVMTLLGLEAVLAATAEPVFFLASAANGTLLDKLATLGKQHAHLKVHPLPYQSSKLEALKNRLKPSRISSLAAELRNLAPTLVIAVQGNIEHSSLALLAARKAGIPSTSYIPVPHSHAEMGAKLGRMRDISCSHLFRVPDSFITITDEMAALLKQQGATCPIRVVYNGVDTARFRPLPAQSAREALGLPVDRVILGIIGRVEFSQKQQHLLAEAVASRPDLLESCHLVFAGDGPDKTRLENLLLRLGLQATLLPWTDPAELYPALDALVIPSRYEGLPLVMLEALACETTVLASNRDGMKDVLPLAWRFEPNQVATLSAAIELFIHEGKSRPAAELVNRVRTQMSLDSFKKSFVSTVFALA